MGGHHRIFYRSDLLPSPDSNRVNPLSVKRTDYVPILILPSALPPPRIFRPSYGPGKTGRKSGPDMAKSQGGLRLNNYVRDFEIPPIFLWLTTSFSPEHGKITQGPLDKWMEHSTDSHFMKYFFLGDPNNSSNMVFFRQMTDFDLLDRLQN